MDFELTVLNLLPLTTGQGARGEWKKQEVIFEQPGEFNRKLCIGFWNDKAVEAAGLRPGDRVALSVNVESREYNGRWYTEVRAWRMSRLEGTAGIGAGGSPFGAATQAPVSTSAVASSPSSSSTSPLSGVSGTSDVSGNLGDAGSGGEADDLPF